MRQFIDEDEPYLWMLDRYDHTIHENTYAPLDVDEWMRWREAGMPYDSFRPAVARPILSFDQITYQVSC